MKSISRGTAILALTILTGAAGCTQTDFLNPGTYQVTLVATVDDSAGFECVLLNVLELNLVAVDPPATGGAVIRAIVPTQQGSGVTPGVRDLNFSGQSCPVGQCNVSGTVCAEDAACSARVGHCLGSGQECTRDNQCPDVGQGTRRCDSYCATSTASCATVADCDAGDTCDLPTTGVCFLAFPLEPCTATTGCDTIPNDYCVFNRCSGTSIPCVFNADCPANTTCGEQRYCQTTPRSCALNSPPAGFRCDTGDTCQKLDVCNRFNARNAPPSFALSAGTYRIVSVRPSSLSLRDLDNPDNFLTCNVNDNLAEGGSTELVGLANDDPSDLVFTVGPGQPNQIVLTIQDIAGLGTGDIPDCYVNERDRFFHLTAP